MIPFHNTDLPNLIELRDIYQSYDEGKTFMIENFNFLIEDKPHQGQFAVILGMSGSGKSTILRYIAGLQKPTKGTVLVKGKPVSEENRVSMVFQQYSSLPWMSVLDNVALGLRFQGMPRSERDARAEAMIAKVGLKGHELKYAQYPTLSGGQLQRVAIARSLLANPDVLLMDEPFGALDVKTRLQMQDLLLQIWAEMSPTIIFITHDIAEAVYLGEDIYIMKAAPAYIVEHVKVTLPLHRNRDIKRMPEFTQLVHKVEDLMIKVTEMS